jgi:hypothetical protein
MHQASKAYEEGRFHSSIQMVEPMLTRLNKNQRFEGLRLLCIDYLSLNDNQKGIYYAEQLLKAKPDYRDYPYFDPLELTKLLASYDVWPMFEAGIKAGTNVNSIRVIQSYSLGNSGSVFNPGWGYQYGLTAEYFPKKNLSLALDLLYMSLAYSCKTDHISGWNEQYDERLYQYSIPMVFRYWFLNTKTIRIALEAGIQTDLFHDADASVELTNPVSGELFQKTILPGSHRNRLNLSMLSGLIGKYKIGAGFLVSNIRFCYGMTNIVKASSRLTDPEQMIGNVYTDSDISFMPICVCVGYQLPIQGFNKIKHRDN